MEGGNFTRNQAPPFGRFGAHHLSSVFSTSTRLFPLFLTHNFLTPEFPKQLKVPCGQFCFCSIFAIATLPNMSEEKEIGMSKCFLGATLVLSCPSSTSHTKLVLVPDLPRQPSLPFELLSARPLPKLRHGHTNAHDQHGGKNTYCHCHRRL